MADQEQATTVASPVGGPKPKKIPVIIACVSFVVDLILLLTPSWWILSEATTGIKLFYGPLTFYANHGWDPDLEVDGFGFAVGVLCFPGVPYLSVLLWMIAIILIIVGLVKARKAICEPTSSAYVQLCKKAGCLLLAAGILCLFAELFYIAGCLLLGGFIETLAGTISFNMLLGPLMSLANAVVFIVTGVMMKKTKAVVAPVIEMSPA